MKKILTILLFVSGFIGQAQTASTKDKLKAMTTLPSSATFYKVVENNDTMYYKADYSNRSIADGQNVIVSTGGVHFVRFVSSVGTAQPPIPDTSAVFTAKQLAAINQMILDSINKNVPTLWFDGMTGNGTKESPLKPRQ